MPSTMPDLGVSSQVVPAQCHERTVRLDVSGGHGCALTTSRHGPRALLAILVGGSIIVLAACGSTKSPTSNASPTPTTTGVTTQSKGVSERSPSEQELLAAGLHGLRREDEAALGTFLKNGSKIHTACVLREMGLANSAEERVESLVIALRRHEPAAEVAVDQASATCRAAHK